MFRSILFLFSLAASAAAAEDLDLTDLISSKGLAGAEAELTASDPATRFALGGVRFLRAIETSLQLRYRHNADFQALDIPVLRLPLPPNPNSKPFYPGIVADIFRQVNADMETARSALSGLEGDFGVRLDLAKIWFDINENGRQDQGEGLMAALGASLGVPAPQDIPELVVRFDAADAAWLRAYTHLLEGVGNLVLAFDPTEVITEVSASIAALNALRGSHDSRRIFLSSDDETFVDMFAMIYGAINRTPDANHTRAARDHWLDMVAQNRLFWSAVAQESDNDAEWIPNATQTAALGFELPPDTGATWLAVLNDAEAVLKGELLVGHWHTSPGAGVNVAKLMENPVPVDIVTWIHGHGLLDFMERGPLVRNENLRQMERMFGGEALLYMVLLN